MTELVYDGRHKVVVCTTCRSCIRPGREQQRRHLSEGRHSRLLKGEELRSTVDRLQGFDLRTEEELIENLPGRQQSHRAIIGIPVEEGFRCLQVGCSYLTTNYIKMREHQPRGHGIRAALHGKAQALWGPCQLQSYFGGRGKSKSAYFAVLREDKGEGEGKGKGDFTVAATIDKAAPDSELFDKLGNDQKLAREDLDRQLGTVQGFGDSRAERVPWLEKLGIEVHTRGLRDAEIRRSFRLPRKTGKGIKASWLPGHGEGEGEVEGEGEGEGIGVGLADGQRLVLIIEAAEEMLRDSWELCDERSEKSRMTWQRAVILGDFQGRGSSVPGGIAGKGEEKRAFRANKEESTIWRYFTIAKQMIAYYYRVSYRDGGHFHRVAQEQQGGVETKLPQEVIVTTERQSRTMDEIVAVSQTSSPTGKPQRPPGRRKKRKEEEKVKKEKRPTSYGKG